MVNKDYNWCRRQSVVWRRRPPNTAARDRTRPRTEPASDGTSRRRTLTRWGTAGCSPTATWQPPATTAATQAASVSDRGASPATRLSFGSTVPFLSAVCMPTNLYVRFCFSNVNNYWFWFCHRRPALIGIMFLSEVAVDRVHPWIGLGWVGFFKFCVGWLRFA